MDGQDMTLLLAVGEPFEELLGRRVGGERLCEVVGEVDLAGLVIERKLDVESSPASTAALARLSALTPIMNCPPITATVLR